MFCEWLILLYEAAILKLQNIKSSSTNIFVPYKTIIFTSCRLLRFDLAITNSLANHRHINSQTNYTFIYLQIKSNNVLIIKTFGHYLHSLYRLDNWKWTDTQCGFGIHTHTNYVVDIFLLLIKLLGVCMYLCR